MALVVNIYYSGKPGMAQSFAKEMMESGVVAKIRAEKGNLKYQYFICFDDPDTVLLIDSWENQEAIDVHHATPMMAEITRLREKYDLHMRVERFVSDEAGIPESDLGFIKQ